MSKYCWDLLQSLTLKSSLVPAGFRCEGSSVTPWRQSCSTKTFNRAEPRNTFPRVHSHMCLNSILCSFFVVAFFLTTHPISHLWLDNRDTTTATDDATYETVSENLLAAFTWRCSDWLTCILTSQRYEPVNVPLACSSYLNSRWQTLQTVRKPSMSQKQITKSLFLAIHSYIQL